VFEAVGLQGIGEPYSADSGVALVNVSRIAADTRPGTLVYEPGHPDANAQGYVEYPNVNAVEEMVNMITASRAYEAGITSIESVKQMARSALSIAK
jgi:flagellar basal-body rod protein FlgC